MYSKTKSPCASFSLLCFKQKTTTATRSKEKLKGVINDAQLVIKVKKCSFLRTFVFPVISEGN